MIKCTGKEWREFCAALPDCVYFEDCESPEEIQPGDRLHFAGGEVCWQSGTTFAVPGVLTAQELERIRDRRAYFTVECLFKRWQKAQTSETVAVQIPKADAEKFAALMKANGWKVVKS